MNLLTSEPREGPRLAAELCAILAGAVCWLVNSVSLFLATTMPADASLRVAQVAYDGAHLLALALFAVLLLLATRAGRPLGWGSRVRVAVFALALFALGWLVLRDDLSSALHRGAAARWANQLGLVLIVAASLGLVLGAHLSSRARSAAVRLVLVLAAGSMLAMNHVVLKGDYPGIHLFLMLFAAALFAGVGSSFGALSFPKGRRRALWGALTLASVLGLAVRPSNAVYVEMLKSDGSVPTLFWVKHSASTVTSPPEQGGRGPWFTRGTLRPQVMPTPDNPVPDNAIVVLLSVDAMRADLLRRPADRRRLPHLVALQSRAVDFTMARTPGSQTVYTLTSLFAGTYFSQQDWTREAPLKTGEVSWHLFPHEEAVVRFPEVLQQAGVATVSIVPAVWMTNSVGVLRGFDEDHFVSTADHWTRAEPLTDAIVERLTSHGDGPLFLYAHFLDPHAPYDLGGEEGGLRDRYVREVAVVDEAIGRVVASLKSSGCGDARC